MQIERQWPAKGICSSPLAGKHITPFFCLVSFPAEHRKVKNLFLGAIS